MAIVLYYLCFRLIRRAAKAFYGYKVPYSCRYPFTAGWTEGVFQLQAERGLEPTTFSSAVMRLDHYTTEPKYGAAYEQFLISKFKLLLRSLKYSYSKRFSIILMLRVFSI